MAKHNQLDPNSVYFEAFFHSFFPCLAYEFGAPGDAFSAPAELMPSDLCYAIFTSGSTGASWELDHPKIFHGIILCLQAIGCNLEAGF